MSSHDGHRAYAHDLRANYLAQAHAWDAAGRPDHAAQLYAAAVGLEPGDARTRLRLAECLVRCGQLSQAAGEYLRIALEYAAHRRDREALALCYRVLQLDARHLVYVALADALRGIGRESRGLCAAAAEAHLAAGRTSDGLHMLRLGVELDARNPEVRRRLATLYRSQHMTNDAVTHLAEAGRLLLAAGNNAEYIEVAEELLALAPRHLETLRDLPRAYLRVGEPRRAVVKLADLMRVSPGDIAGYEILAHAFAAIDRVSTCLSVLERLVSELRATGRDPQAQGILDRAPGWRLDDAAFAKAVQALRQPKAPPKPAPVRPETAEGTVVLDIRDLLPNRVLEDTTVLPADDVIELGDGEGTMVLRLEDLSHVGPAPRRAAAPRRAPTVPPPRPRIPATASPSRAAAMPPSPRAGAPMPSRPAAVSPSLHTAAPSPSRPAAVSPSPRAAAPTPSRPAAVPPSPRDPLPMPSPRAALPMPSPRAVTPSPRAAAPTPSRPAAVPPSPRAGSRPSRDAEVTAPSRSRGAMSLARLRAAAAAAATRPGDGESTMALDLPDIEIDDDTEVQRPPSGDVTDFVFDEDSGEVIDVDDDETLRMRGRLRLPMPSAPPPPT